MPAFRPISQRKLIKYLRKAGFEGPIQGPDQPYMFKGDLSLKIANPHPGDIGIDLLSKILDQAGISRKEWERL
jgi:predicted RNA binding protein YcfA (HicA-like mRNA interferase family)